MPRAKKTAEKAPRWYRGTDVTMRVIRKYVRAVAARFEPDRIILFGSHAHGTPHADSDVDLLVIMPCRDRIRQAVNIRWAFPAAFPLDLIVRTPRQMADRLGLRDSFLTEIVTAGKTLYEAPDTTVGPESGIGLAGGSKARGGRPRGV